ncbi:MAG: tetraacyldisaccharide 4'-kinase [Cyclobacteriaceae bacterium]|nr:tetraacyldisaccharide 4'-kinase [Cyclobacteriaceae bacterium]
MIFIRILLFPFAVLYDAVTRFRNHLFNIGNKPSFVFDTNVVGVGNLSVGGTGKTPMVEYLIRLLSEKYSIATLSRGYGRSTKGFRIANEEDTPSSIGDEPFQIFNKFKKVHVTVGEERALAIPAILHEKRDTQVIILDDAFQHRYVKPNINILLTGYQKPFFNDYVLPAGTLREAREGVKRADVIVVTKCPSSLTIQEKNHINKKIDKYKSKDTSLFFSTISYDDPVPLHHNIALESNVILLSGIANNSTFATHMEEHHTVVHTFLFSDHHNYSQSDVKKVVKIYEKFKSNEQECSIITTEKDMVKLDVPEFRTLLRHIPLFYLPIKTQFLENGEVFDNTILNSIQTNR